MANQWFRLYSEFAHDPKVQMLSESDQRRLVMLLCLRCSNGNVTLQDKHVTFQLRISNDEWASSKAIFIESGFIDESNNILNWDKRQYASDSSAERVARHREKARNASVTPVTTGNVTVTPPEQIQNRTESDQSQNKVKTLRPFAADIFPEVLDRQLVNDWITVRKKKDAPVTKTALAGFMREVQKSGLPLEDVLRRCCEHSWAGFKAEWVLRDSRASPVRNKQEALEESNRASTAGWMPPELREMRHAN